MSKASPNENTKILKEQEILKEQTEAIRSGLEKLDSSKWNKIGARYETKIQKPHSKL